MRLFAFLIIAWLSAPLAQAVVQIGQEIPNLAVLDYTGKTHNLHDFKGRTVVLEWTNFQCPFVNKHYGSGNMQNLQQAAVADGVLWLAVISSAPGKQGYLTQADAGAALKQHKFAGTTLLLDPQGALGRTFDATATPHMYIIRPDLKLAYAGAIDSIPSFRQNDIPDATNYVQLALAELRAGTAPSIPQTVAYGCSIKY